MKIYYMGVRDSRSPLLEQAAYMDIDSPQRDQACLGALWREGPQQVYWVYHSMTSSKLTVRSFSRFTRENYNEFMM
jgi:hypothetical protein